MNWNIIHAHVDFLQKFFEENNRYTCFIDPNPMLGMLIIPIKQNIPNLKIIGIYKNNDEELIDNTKHNIIEYTGNSDNVSLYSYNDFKNKNDFTTTTIPLIFYRFNRCDISLLINDNKFMNLSSNQHILLSCPTETLIPDKLNKGYHIKILFTNNKLNIEYILLYRFGASIETNNLYFHIFNDEELFNEKTKLKEMLYNRFHEKCPLMYDFIYDTLKKICQNDKDDKIVFKKLMNAYRSDPNICNIYRGSECYKFLPFIYGNNYHRLDEIKELIPGGSNYKNILVIGSIDCDITSPLHKSFTTSKIYVIDTVDTKPRYGDFFKVEENSDDLFMIASKSINLIISISLHHFKNPKFINELYRILSDTGVLVMYEHNCENGFDVNVFNMYHLFYEYVLSKIEEGHTLCNYKSKNEWNKLLKEAGFSIEKDKDRETTTLFKIFITAYNKKIVEEEDEEEL